MVYKKATHYHLLLRFKDIMPLVTAQEFSKYVSCKWGEMMGRPRVHFEIQNEKELA